MPKAPEILMDDWPNPTQRKFNPIGERYGAWVYWPISKLPDAMGWMPEGEKIPGDPSDDLYALVEATFHDEFVTLQSLVADANDHHPIGDLPYVILEKMDQIRIYRDFKPSDEERSAGLSSRRYNGFVHMTEPKDEDLIETEWNPEPKKKKSGTVI